MATKSRGAPYPLGTDANNTAADIEALAGWVNDRPGVAALTTTQRNALTGVELWDGRAILNTTLDKFQRYDAGLVTWVTIADESQIAALLTTSGTASADARTASRGVSAFAARSDHVHPTPDWIDYDPVWTSTAGSPTIGNGNIKIRYAALGKTINWEFFLAIGTTTTLGTAGGQWRFTLPVAAFYGFSYVRPLGVVNALDSGARQYGGLALPVSGSSTLFYLWSDRGASETSFTPSTPFAWAAGDIVQASGSYEAV